MDNLSRRAMVSLLSSYASQFATTATNLVTKLLLARLIAPDDLGLYALALLVLLGCDMLVDLGVSQHIIREKHRPYGNLLVLRLSVAVVLFTIVELIAGKLRFWGAEFPPVMSALAVVILIKAVSGVPNLFLDRELLIQRSVLPQFLRLLATGAVSIGLASFHYGVWALVWGTIAGEMAFALTIWKAARGRMPIELTWKHSAGLIWGSKFLFLIGCMGFALQQGDIAIIGTLLDSRQVGYYTLAYTLVILVSKVVESAIFRVIYPMFCEYKDDLRNLGRTYRQATLAVIAIEAPIYFYLLFNAPVVVSVLLGEKWMPAAFLMQALSVYGIINPFSTFGNEVLRARKRDNILTLSTAIGAATLMTSGYILTLRYGTIGMVAANYIMIGSIPAILTVYKTVRQDFTKLAGQLGIVYSTSFAVIAVVSAGLSLAAHTQALVAGLLVPACWYTYYRIFGNGLGRKTIDMLMAARSAAAVEAGLQGGASS